jgi:5'-nucleotidase
VLKLHAGDALTGDLYFTQSEGQADAALMNTVCFDAFTLGNHEFDGADAGLVKFIDYPHAGACKTPVLSANVKPAAGTPLAARVPTTASSSAAASRSAWSALTVKDKTRFASRPDAGTSFLDEATAAQAAIDALRARG